MEKHPVQDKEANEKAANDNKTANPNLKTSNDIKVKEKEGIIVIKDLIKRRENIQKVSTDHFSKSISTNEAIVSKRKSLNLKTLFGQIISNGIPNGAHDPFDKSKNIQASKRSGKNSHSRTNSKNKGRMRIIMDKWINSKNLISVNFDPHHKDKNFSYDNKVLSPDYHLVKCFPNANTELEIVKTVVPYNTNVRERINFNHYKARDYSYIRACSPSCRNLNYSEIECAGRNSLDSTAISKHIPTVQYSKMLERPSDLFSVEKDDAGVYYNALKDVTFQKTDINNIKFEKQYSRDEYERLNQKKLAPEIDPDRVKIGFSKLGHIKVSNTAPRFDRQYPKEVTKSVIARRKARNLCSAMNKYNKRL